MTKQERLDKTQADIDNLGDPMDELIDDPPTLEQWLTAEKIANTRLRLKTSLHGQQRVLADDEAQAEYKQTLRDMGKKPRA